MIVMSDVTVEIDYTVLFTNTILLQVSHSVVHCTCLPSRNDRGFESHHLLTSESDYFPVVLVGNIIKVIMAKYLNKRKEKNMIKILKYLMVIYLIFFITIFFISNESIFNLNSLISCSFISVTWMGWFIHLIYIIHE